MTDDRHDSRPTPPEATAPEVSPERARAERLRGIALHKSQRRERARRRGTDNIWSWMGMFGLVGWTVAIPTLLGLALGVFVDNRVESSVSFAITFLVVGVAIGAATAWYWVREESRGDDGP
jgi:ATP synthase protein I